MIYGDNIIKPCMISVLMPVYNESLYIVEAVESVLAQKNVDFEIIIVDDFSTDNTFSVLVDNYSKYENITILKNLEKGKNNAFNLAFSYSCGGTIVFFAGDDVLTPNSLLVRYIDTPAILKVKTGKIRSFSNYKRFDGVLYPKGNRPNFSGGATAFSRALAERIFPIPGTLPNEDNWTRIHIEYFDVLVEWTNDVVLNYRINDYNSTGFNSGFRERSLNIHKRNSALPIFLQNYRGVLSDKSVSEIERLVIMENYRFRGFTVKIILLKNISFKRKVISLFYSNIFLYNIRSFLNKYLSGLL